MKLKAQASIQIQKPINTVFEAIVNPMHMTQFFISESTGNLETGKEVIWKFQEFSQKFPITQIQIKKNKSISFVWDPETVVNIKIEELPEKNTLVKIKEDGKEFNEENLKWALENSGGWSNFLACLKAYLEYGINLRKGAFDFMRTTNRSSNNV